MLTYRCKIIKACSVFHNITWNIPHEKKKNMLRQEEYLILVIEAASSTGTKILVVKQRGCRWQHHLANYATGPKPYN